MSETDVLIERLSTHITDSNDRHKQHEDRIRPLEEFMLEMRIDVKWVKIIGGLVLAFVASPWAFRLFELITKR